jgi:adenylosuccinate lyase
MMEAVKSGAGREMAHEVIKEHAVQVAKEMRTGRIRENDLLVRLVTDSRLSLTAEDMQRLIAAGKSNTGDASEQVDAFCCRVEAVMKAYPEGANYEPGMIL